METKNTFYLQLSKRFCLIIVFLIFYWAGTMAGLPGDTSSYVSNTNGKGFFPLCVAGNPAPLYASQQEYPGVIRAIKNLQADINSVTQVQPILTMEQAITAKNIVVIGTLGNNPWIDQWVKEKKLNVANIAGHWETSLTQVVEKPFPNVDKALVILGSDKRGTIYGIYDLSYKIGVSPWYWWADVPIKQQNTLYVKPGSYSQGEPAVKYRGFFINDEAPALSGWASKKFKGFNHQFYEKVFELLLRLKANYLWPAMWGNAFNDDDKLNPQLADEYGIVMGTSHHEPMMRAQQEWKRHGSGPWNYNTNDSVLNRFWEQGIRNMGTKESIITIGMRGDGDEPMSEDSNIALLEKIVKNQRETIARVTGKKPEDQPQLWALYKEVQDYYDKGMRVPDDITLLLCDDNWGNIRKLPNPAEKVRQGGYGIYYHYDYVGGPRNYKWLNTNPIQRVWEQMHLAYEYGATRIWIVNVGDIKPMEFPIEFFMDYAWNPKKMPANRMEGYTKLWAEKQFGAEHAKTIAHLITAYTKFNGRRKPELLSPKTYSLTNYQEAETIVKDYNKIASEADSIGKLIPAAYKDAYYQLVLYPILACANVNNLYVAAGKNELYAKQGRASTNLFADSVKALFKRDSLLSYQYNKIMADGKWDHMMDQTHIGYTNWQQPSKNIMPQVKTIEVPATAEMGMAIEGSENWWPSSMQEAILPEFNGIAPQSHYLELFNRGSAPFEYSASATEPWIKINPAKGTINLEQRLWVSIDWPKAPDGNHKIPITINGANGSKTTAFVVVKKTRPPQIKGFAECNGYVSIEAEHYTKASAPTPIHWETIPELGRTLSGITPVPTTSPKQIPGGNSPMVEYDIYAADTGKVSVHVYLSPTLNFEAGKGLSYGISFDGDEPQIINIHADKSLQAWEKWVSNNINITISQHKLKTPGNHTLKFWMVSPGLVLQKLVVDFGGLKPSYLGPPESFYMKK